MLNLYQEIIMDHYRNPRNYQMLDYCHFKGEEKNSSCGDEIVFMGIIDNSVVSCATYQGKGCVISQATASMLSERIKDMSLDDIQSLDQAYISAMIGMSLGPVRMMCALLPLLALQKGIDHYKCNKNE